MTVELVQMDAVEFLRRQPEASIDLVFGSPPYMDARTYGIGAVYDCRQWVDWMLQVTEAAVRASKGLVVWVAAGVQRDNCYWPGCEGLTWEWWKRGNQLWAPAVWWKVDDDEGGCGIPGSGGNVPGKRWLRKDWEYCLCFKKAGGIPYDLPTVMGHEPVYGRVGGEMSNRTQDGQRANDRVGDGVKARRGRWGGSTRRANGGMKEGSKDGARVRTMDATAGHDKDGNTGRADGRPMPKIANPGNCIIVKARVGGGHMGGDALCSQNEAPFPEKLAEFFVLSYCAPGGLVCDPFSGSGTTAVVAKRHGRSFTGCDLRQSQVDLGLRRLAEETPMMFS